jgi:hypothetical protein
MMGDDESDINDYYTWIGNRLYFFLVFTYPKKLVACVNYSTWNDVDDFQDKHIEKIKWNYAMIVIFFCFLVLTRLMFPFNFIQSIKLS